MTERGTGKRTQTHEIAIAAPVEAVWKAITDAEELTRWFVEAAKVEPGVGGSFWISWGGAEEGESRIEVWEPNQKLRVALKPFDMGPAKYDATSPIVDEYTIERRDGKTVLRLVSSGIPNTPEWDGFYDGTNTGWAQFFRMMRHYLRTRRPGIRTGCWEVVLDADRRRRHIQRRRRVRQGAARSRTDASRTGRRAAGAFDGERGRQSICL